LQLYSDAARPGAFLFENTKTKNALSRSQGWRIINTAGKALGIEIPTNGHGCRKTLGYHTWKDSSDPEKDILLLMHLYNHSSPAVTKLYLGITQDDINAIFLNTKLIA